MRKKLSAARVPRSVRRAVRQRLRTLTTFLGWALIDPAQDAPKVLASCADVSDWISKGIRIDIAQQIRHRATELRKSNLHEDLVAAGELEDIAFDIEPKEEELLAASEIEDDMATDIEPKEDACHQSESES